ncbi:MAG: L-threonylcarbamoyladenylate synthase [Eubacteriales bacterium]|nr:L-threonylcarbamoyladenylate synthase [Eubacteriales bacterium]
MAKLIDASEAADDISIQEAATALMAGELVVFPTETVYGLGAIVSNEDALRHIYRAKGRPSDNPLIIHVSDEEMFFQYAKDSEAASILINHFCPGPLTLVVPARDSLSRVITAGLDTVAIRIPCHPLAQDLIRATGEAIAAPSANRSGRPSATRASDAFEDLENDIAYCIDGGPSEVGLESTIVDLSVEPFQILRPGYYTAETLNLVFKRLGKYPKFQVVEAPIQEMAKQQGPKAPGMKYRHYAPETEVLIIEGSSLEKRISDFSKKCADLDPSDSIAAFVSSELASQLEARGLLDSVELIQFSSPVDASHRLFAVLRDFDQPNTRRILVESLDGDTIEIAYMNRLRKAASSKQEALK